MRYIVSSKDTKGGAAEEYVLIGQAGWTRAAIQAQVERLCTSVAFFDGQQARKLLPYLVGEALAGRMPDAGCQENCQTFRQIELPAR